MSEGTKLLPARYTFRFEVYISRTVCKPYYKISCFLFFFFYAPEITDALENRLALRRQHRCEVGIFILRVVESPAVNSSAFRQKLA